MSECDVCGKPAVGVAASVTGPVSFGYCQECLKAKREPYWAWVACVSSFGADSLDEVAEWARKSIRASVEFEGKTLDQFFADAKAAWDEYVEKMKSLDGHGGMVI